MTRAALEGPRKWRIEEVEAPKPGVGEVRVRLEGCGVCASGLPSWQGREWFEYPLEPGSLGHEGWGVIDSIGAGVGEDVEVGDRVAFLADGSYTTRLCLSADRVMRLPPSLDGQPFPAEPVGCAVNVIARSGIEVGMTVMIVGMGFLGSLLLQLIHLAGARAVCVSNRPFSRQIAEKLGAVAVAPMGEPWQVREALSAMGHDRFPCVIECTGVARGLDIATEFAQERGKLVVAGYHQDGLRQVNMQQWNWLGIDVINAHERDPARYRSGMLKGIGHASRGEISLKDLLTHRYPLRRIDAAYRDLEDRPEGFMKGWIDLTENAL